MEKVEKGGGRSAPKIKKVHNSKFRLFWDEGGGSWFSKIHQNQMTEIWPWFWWYIADILVRYCQNECYGYILWVSWYRNYLKIGSWSDIRWYLTKRKIVWNYFLRLEVHLQFRKSDHLAATKARFDLINRWINIWKTVWS